MATHTSAPQELLFTIPEPRQIILTGGMTELSEDVRLVTSNVLPLYRKTMRTVLAAAGIRVVANKKKFIIDIRVEQPGVLELQDVPEAAREEYYEIDLQDNAVTVRTATQIGALWGTHTLAGIYKAKARGIAIPNLRLRDWPDHSLRGAVLKSLWGLDRLTAEEWAVVFERLAATKLNLVGIPLDGGRTAVHPDTHSEGLLAPFADAAEAARENHLSWYSPNLKIWKSEKALPKFHATDPVAGDYLKQILNMARENGLTPVPAMSGLGEETALPALFPKTAAQDTGSKTGVQTFCLSAPETRKTLEAYYGGLLQRFFPEGAPYFMVKLAVPDAKALCQCPKCKKQKLEVRIQEHLEWLVGVLDTHRVRHLLVQDELPAELGQAAFSAAYAKQLQKGKLFDRVILLTRPADNGKAAKKPAADAAGWQRWSMPAVNAAGWMTDKTAEAAINAAVPAGFKAGMRGTAIETVWDAQTPEFVANFANLAWRSQAPLPAWRSAADLYALTLGADADAVLAARDLMAAVLGGDRPLTRFLHTTPFFVHLTPRDANGSFCLAGSLATLAGGKTAAAARAHLRELAATGRKSTEQLAALLDREQKPSDVELVRSLLCEVARISGLAQALDQLLELPAENEVKADAKSLKLVQTVRTGLIDTLTQIENRRNKLTAPLKLSEFSPLLGIVEQLCHDLQTAVDAKKKTVELRWSWKFPVLP